MAATARQLRNEELMMSSDVNIWLVDFVRGLRCLTFWSPTFSTNDAILYFEKRHLRRTHMCLSVVVEEQSKPRIPQCESLPSLTTPTSLNWPSAIVLRRTLVHDKSDKRLEQATINVETDLRLLQIKNRFPRAVAALLCK